MVLLEDIAMDRASGSPSHGDSTPPEEGRWLLDAILIQNFKSFKDLVRIETLQKFPFIAVIGPNGSGKSNLMDAISFVMGERTASLRVRRLDELIYGASIGKPVGSTASVTAVFTRSIGHTPDRKTFSRAIRGVTSAYSIDELLTTQQVYVSELKKLGINAKGKNFLVFQGDIENVAMKNAKERTALLEEICGSGALKTEYEQTKDRMREAEKKTESSYMLKKGLIAQRKEVVLEAQEASHYNDLLKEMADKEVETVLFKLYHIQNEITRIDGESYRKDLEERRLEKLKTGLGMEYKAKKQESGKLNQALVLKESILRESEKEKDKVVPRKIELNERRKHMEKKLQAIEKSLKHAQENKKNHEQDLQQLHQNLRKIQEEKQAFLQLYDDMNSQEGLDLTLRDSQIREYWDLKQQVLKQIKNEKAKLEAIQTIKRDKDDVYNSLNREKAELNTKIEITEHEINSEKKLERKVQEILDELQEQLQVKETEVQPLRKDIEDAENTLKTLREELEKVSVSLDTAKSDRYESKRQSRQRETIEALKRRFSGVIDRVTNLCDPIHSKYTIAITKIMGKHMDAIVVDNEKTARLCIQYMKEQMIETESFLPLDFLQVIPLRTSFRNLGNGIRLAYDLLKFDKRIDKAILHCTKSTVVCPTTQLASAVASGLLGQEAANAVSLEGTFYSTSGIISGGLADLQRKAKRWDDSKINEMEEQKKWILDNIRENGKKIRGRVNLHIVEQEIQGIKTRLKYANHDFKTHNDKAAKLEIERKNLLKELEILEQLWTKAKGETCKLAEKQKMYVKKINMVEDKIFAVFCQQVGLSNIRAYEEKDVRAQEEFNGKKQEIDNKIQEIETQLDFEISHGPSLEDKVKQWENAAMEVQQNLENGRREEEKVQQSMTELENKLSNFKDEIDKMKKAIDLKGKEMTQANKQLIRFDEMILAAKKTSNLLESTLYQVKLQRHELYKQCKLSGTVIPLEAECEMSLDNVYLGSGSTNIEENTTPSETAGSVGVTYEALNQEDGISVNFVNLPAKMKTVLGDNVKKVEKELEDELHELETQIRAFQAPNLKAGKKLEAINAKARQQQEEFDKIRREANEARATFEKVKKERFDLFMACYEKIARNIEGIYKELTQNHSAQAVLGLDNPEEPYLEGVTYHCVAPGKRFQSMNNLSGGERTLAALALLFAIHSYEPTPFFVLDEIDAALDNTNIGKVISYIKQKSKDCQFIVISLKEDFFEHANAIIGVAPAVDEVECISSKVCTLNLDAYLE